MEVPGTISPTESPAATREALLASAAEVFAERGFRDATIREICQRAGANVAAIHYHFGDKERLYAEVLSDTSREATLAHSVQHVPAATSPELRLAEYIRSFLARVLAAGRESIHGRLMTREMVEPTAALDRVVHEFIRPQAEALRELIAEIVGPGFTREELGLLVMSVVSQIVFYKHCDPVLQRLHRAEGRDLPDPETLATHITRFTLAALHELAAQRRPTPPC